MAIQDGIVTLIDRLRGAASRPKGDDAHASDSSGDLFTRLLNEGDTLSAGILAARYQLPDRPIDMQEFVTAVKSEVRRSVDFDRLLVLITDDDTYSVADGAATGSLDALGPVRRVHDKGVTQISLVLTDTEEGLFGGAVESAAYVPVCSGSHVAGVLALGWRDPDAAKRANVKPVERLAGGLFPSLATTLLYKRSLDAEQDALALVDAVGALSSKLTVDEVSNVACLHTRKLARSKTVRLVMLDDEGELDVYGCNPGASHPANRVRKKTPGLLRAIDDEEVVFESTDRRPSVFLPVKIDGIARGVLELSYPPDASGPPERIVRLCEAIASQTGAALERAQRADELQRLAFTDALTGLENRRQLLHDLERDVLRAQRTDEPITVAMIDLDHFKAYNDEHGHIAGDRYLRTFARFLQTGVRGMDTAGRYGGEEFLLILPDTADEEAVVVMSRLRHNWKQRGGIGTFSVGIAQLRAGESWTDLVMRADAALYQAKEEGRDVIQIAEDVESPQPETDSSGTITPLPRKRNA